MFHQIHNLGKEHLLWRESLLGSWVILATTHERLREDLQSVCGWYVIDESISPWFIFICQHYDVTAYFGRSEKVQTQNAFIFSQRKPHISPVATILINISHYHFPESITSVEVYYVFFNNNHALFWCRVN